jgi:quinol monooxygenase YgiN
MRAAIAAPHVPLSGTPLLDVPTGDAIMGRMAYLVIATWRAKPESVDLVLDALRELAPATRAEPACRIYQPYRDPDDPLTIHLFEVYDDEAGYRAHTASEHFQRLAAGRAIPELVGRERDFYETVDV